MPDIPEYSEPLLVRVRQVFTKFRSLFVPRAVSVHLRRAKCQRVCRTLSNSKNCREHLYISLLAAITNNEVRHFKWLLKLTVDVLFRDDAQTPPRRWWPIREDIDKAILGSGFSFCLPSIWEEHEMIGTLWQYAVLCGSTEIVENLLSLVYNVSSVSEWWYPFLPGDFSCTALWLAALQCEHNIIRLLLNAGASPYETCSVWYRNREHYLPLTIFRTWEKHLVTQTALESQVFRRRQLKVSLVGTTRLIAEGSEHMVEFLKSTFQWNSLVTLDLRGLGEATLDFFKIPGLRSKFLQLPCYSEEDILRKQAICVCLLLYTVDVLCLNPGSSVRNIEMFSEAIRELVRHGASVCGFTSSTSKRFVARHRETVLSRITPPPHKAGRLGIFLISSSFPLIWLLAPCAIWYIRAEPDLSGRCDMRYPLEFDSSSPETIGLSYFLLALQRIESLDHPVIRELYHCGALPHVKSLESVPFSERDNRIHDGPRCQCEDIELSAVQRKMSVTDLLLQPNIVPTLQATCRNTIINSCQGHGVVPAIKLLPLPGRVIEYLLYNIRI